MKLFKNFRTKQQLREEIAELKGMLYLQRPQIQIAEREIQEQIAHGVVEFLKPLIEWDIEDDNANPFKKRIRGNIYLAKKKEI